MEVLMDIHQPTTEFGSKRARAAQAVKLAASNPATQAACDLISLVISEAPAVKVLPTRFEAADAENGDRWWTGWSCDGQRFGLDLCMHGPSTDFDTDAPPGAQIPGNGLLFLEVDEESVMTLLVDVRRDDPARRIAPVGAAVFEPGPWTDVVVDLLRKLEDGVDPRTGRKAA
jgi:hypothetical protein